MAPERRSKKRARRPPDYRARDEFYILRVGSFAVAGSAEGWYPDELPDVYEHHYITTPERPILHEDLGLHLDLRPIAPPMPDVTVCLGTLWGSGWTPEPDYDHYSGSISKRKDRVEFWFHGSLDLTRSLVSTLLARYTVYVRFQGARIYRGRAGLCGLEWWTGNHPDLSRELEDAGVPQHELSGLIHQPE